MRKLFEFTLGLLIFLSATAYMPGKGFDTAQGIIFRIGIVALVILSLSLKPIRFITNKWLNSLLGLCFALTLLLPPPQQTVALNPFINVFLGVILFYLIVNYSDKSTILNALCWVVIINGIMVILQVFKIDPIVIKANGMKPELTGLFEYRYAFGIYMGVLTPFLLSFKKRTFGIISGILTICSMSFAAIIIMMISLVILMHKTKLFIPVIILSLVTMIIMSFTILLPNNNPESIIYKLQSRYEVYNKFLPVVMQKPIGYGLGCFKFIGPLVVGGSDSKYGDVTDGWNGYLERTMELGFLFLVVFGLLCYDIYKRGGILLIGIPLNMMFHSCFNHFNVSILFIILFSLWEIKQYEKITDIT